MYNVGEVIMYSGMGMCRVMDIEKKVLSESVGEKMYYKLKSLFQKDTICYVPTDTDAVMRKAITKDEAEKLISKIPSLNVKAYVNKNIKELSRHYDEVIRTHDCMNLIKLILSVKDKNCRMEEQKKKLGAVDERYMKRAEDMLFEEFAVSLDLEKDEVHDYIIDKVEASSAN